MAWAKVDDQLHGHPKMLSAWTRSRAAVGLYGLALSYCVRHETGGVVPMSFVTDALPDTAERESAIEALVAEPAGLDGPGLWVPVEGGWRIHGWEAIVCSAREHLSSAIRRQVIARDGLICGLCGGEVSPHDVHVDHIRPVSRGGGNAIENLQVAHSGCNLRKGNRA